MRINPRVLGAFMIGGGLVAFAFLISSITSLSTPVNTTSDARVSVVAGPAPDREPIEVVDSNGNGVPDWREELRIVEPVQLSEVVSATYEEPTTLTGVLAKNLLQDTIESKQRGTLGKSPEDILASAESLFAGTLTDELYYEKHIIIDQNTDREALHAYGNRVAGITFEYSAPPDIEPELLILKEAVDTQDEKRLEDLDLVIASYENMRDAMLQTPVPTSMVKEHLDLINAYHALYMDITAMRAAFDDPLLTMGRIQRYQDDAQGLGNAIVNLYEKLHTFGVRWTPSDIASSLITIQ